MKNVNIQDPKVNQYYAFMWINLYGIKESHENGNYERHPENIKKFIRGIIVKQLRYLYTEEQLLRRELNIK